MFGLGKLFMDDTIKAANKILVNGNKIDSGKPITTVGDFIRGILDERIGVKQTKRGINYIKDNESALYDAIGGKKKHTTFGHSTIDAPTDWQRAKSLFYNRQGEFQYGRAAGAAVGLGGGAIATLNLGYDMVT